MGIENNKQAFLDYLISIGYKIFHHDKCIDSIPYWSNVNGGIGSIKLINTNAPEKVMIIYWGIFNGLCMDVTDTLRHPLPKGVHPDDAVIEMDKIFKTKTPEEIYKSLYNGD